MIPYLSTIGIVFLITTFTNADQIISPGINNPSNLCLAHKSTTVGSTPAFAQSCSTPLTTWSSVKENNSTITLFCVNDNRKQTNCLSVGVPTDYNTSSLSINNYATLKKKNVADASQQRLVNNASQRLTNVKIGSNFCVTAMYGYLTVIPCINRYQQFAMM